MSGNVTKEEVFAAAEALREEGTKTTNQNVRMKLGLRGSYSTISEFMREWRDGHKPVIKKIEETPQAVLDLAANLWSSALAAAQEGLEAERQELEKLRTEIIEELKDATTFADTLTVEVDALRNKNDELATQLENEKQKHEQTRESLQAMTNEMIQYRTEYNATLERANDYKSSATRYEHQYAKSEEMNRNLLKKNSEQDGIIARLEAALDKEQSEKKHQVDNLVDELERLREASRSDKSQVEAANESVRVFQMQVASLQGELNALRSLLQQTKE